MTQLVKIQDVELVPVGAADVGVNYSGAATDDALVELWLGVKSGSENTRLAYQRDVGLFVAFLGARGRSLREATLRDLHEWGASRTTDGPKTLVRRLAAVKSLFSFGQKTGYLRINVGAALELPSVQNQRAERILTEGEVYALINASAPGLHRVAILFLYYTAARAVEACGASWKHLQRQGDVQAQVTLHGKGSKTRHVPFPLAVLDEILSLKGDATDEDPVLVHQGERLKKRELHRIVSGAAERAGVKKKVSPHWLRHSHATHALNRGAPVHFVQATLGHASLATTNQYSHAQPKEGSARFLPLLMVA
jgi:integrase/recombinase XerD